MTGSEREHAWATRRSDVLIDAAALHAQRSDPIESADLVVVDARSPARYRRGHIAGAVNLPLGWLDQLEGTAQALVPAAATVQEIKLAPGALPGGAGVANNSPNTWLDVCKNG